MARPKKNAILTSMKLHVEIHQKLEKFCEETGLSKTTAVEKILQKYFESYFSRPPQERNLF